MLLTKKFKKKKTVYEKRLHDRNISPFGGIATSFAFLVSTIFLGRAEEEFLIIGICAVIISIVGLLDDIINLDWKTKLLAQIIVIVYPVSYTHLTLPTKRIV